MKFEDVPIHNEFRFLGPTSERLRGKIFTKVDPEKVAFSYFWNASFGHAVDAQMTLYTFDYDELQTEVIVF